MKIQSSLQLFSPIRAFYGFFILFSLVVLPAVATNYTWTGSSSKNWSTSGNWSPAGVPGSGDNVTIGSGSDTVQISGNITIANLTMSGRKLNLGGYTLTSTGTSALSGGKVYNGRLLFSGAQVTFSGTADIVSKVKITSPKPFFNGASFADSVVVNSVLASSSTLSSGGTTFNGPLVVSVSGGNYTFRIEGGTRNLYNENVWFTAAGRITFQFANNTGTGTVFNKTLKLVAKDTAYIQQNGASGITTTFNKKVVINSQDSAQVILGSVTGQTTYINDTLEINTTSARRVYISSTGTVILAANVFLSCTNGAGIAFAYNSTGSVTQATGTLKIGTGGFSGGRFDIYRYTKSSSESLNLNLSGTALVLFGTSNSINGSVDIKAPSIYFNGTTFNGSSVFEQTGSNVPSSSGDNTFNGDVVFKQSGTGQIQLCSSSSKVDNFNGKVSFWNNSSYVTADAGIIIISKSGTTNFNGSKVEIFSTSTSRTYFGYSEGSLINLNCNMEVNSSDEGSIYLGWRSGKVKIGNGKTISTGSSGFSKGELSFYGVEQTGTEPINIAFTGTQSRLVFLRQTIYPYLQPTLQGDFTYSGPRLSLDSALFYGNVTINLISSATSNVLYSRGCNFYKNVELTNNSSFSSVMGYVEPDFIFGDANFSRLGSGNVYPAYTGQNVFKGNISTKGNVEFANNGGKVLLDGTTDQTIGLLAGASGIPTIKKLKIAKSGGFVNLNTNLIVTDSLQLVTGIVKMGSSNYLDLKAGSKVVSASNSSYVDGQVRKTGNTAFSFPIGSDNKYLPLSISAPSNSTDAFTAKYFSSSANTSYSFASKDGTLNNLDEKGYWTLDRNVGTSTPNVTLNFGSNYCGTGTPSSLKVANWNGSTWKDRGNSSTTSTSITVNTQSGFGPFLVSNLINSATANAGSDVSVCSGSSVSLSGSGTGIGSLSYSWDPSTGLSSTTVSNPSANPTATTTYYLKVTDSYGCTGTDGVVVTVNALPTANAGSDVAFCAGSSVGLSASASGGTPSYTYAWSPSIGLSSSSVANPTASPSSITTYTVTVTDSKGCSANDAVVVTVNPLPTANAGNDVAFCAGASVSLSASASSGTPSYSYSWSPSTGLSSASVSNPTASPSSTITYTLTVTDSKGCSANDAVVVTVNPLPTANAGSDVAFCAGSSVGLSASASGGTPSYTYEWSPSTGLSSSSVANPTASPSSTTTYTVTVTDSKGCSANDGVVVTVNPLPTANAGNDTTIYHGDTLQIGTSSIASNSYSWYPTGSLNNGSIAIPNAFPSDTTRYIVTVTNSEGCVKKDTIWVNIFPGYSGNKPITLGETDSCRNDVNTVSIENDIWLSFIAKYSALTIRTTRDTIYSSYPDSIFIFNSACNTILYKSNEFNKTLFVYGEEFEEGATYKILIKKGKPEQEFQLICINNASYISAACAFDSTLIERGTCNYSCDCSHNPASINLKYEKPSYYRDGFFNGLAPHKDVKLYIHILQFGNYNATNPNFFVQGNSFHNSFLINDVNSVINWLNRIWNGYVTVNNMPPSGVTVTDIPTGANITFVPQIVYHTVTSTEWNSTSFSGIMSYIRAQDGYCKYNDGINYILGNAGFPNYSGYSTVPSCNLAQDDGVYTGPTMSWYIPNVQGGQIWGWPLAWHMAHELGHTFGLFHTYPSGSDYSDPSCDDYLADVFGIPFGGFPILSPSGLNNIMAASQNSAYFSPLQIGRIHRNLSLKSVRKAVSNCPLALSPILISGAVSGPETWDFDIRVYNNIEVVSTLTLGCQVEMEDAARIIVEPRGHLIIDGGTVTNACTVWEGIRVKSIASSWGYCDVINGGTVSNAKTGIGVFGDEVWLNTGGKLYIDNAHFINNRKAIAFGSYPNTPNQSIIQNSEFLCDYPMNSPNYTITDPVTSSQVRLGAQAFISNWNTIGVQIKDNLFKMETTYDYFNPSNCSTTSESFPEKYWTDGIVTYDARMQVTGTNLTTPTCNKFVNLKSGINIDKTINLTTRYLYVYKNQFENCLQGIYSKSSQNDMFFHNEFKIPSSYAQTLDAKPFGVFLDNYKHAVVGGNYFSDYSTDTDPARWGLVIKYSGSNTDNADIRWNSFQNLKYGFQAEGPHYAAKLRCNDFTTIDYEWLIDPNGSATNVFNTQGNCFFGGAQARPGNRFFDSGNHITSDASNQWFYRTSLASTILPTFASPPIIGTVQICPTPYSYIQSCPSYPYSIAPNPPYPPLFEREALALTIDSLVNIKDSLTGILDNGQTDTLLARIGRSSYSNNSLTTDLVSNSPLSDTVLVSIFGRSTALNDSLLIAAFIPNSPVSKKVTKHFYKALNEYDSATQDTLAKAQISNPGYLSVEGIQRLLDYQTTELNTKLSEVVGYYAFYDSLFPNLIGFLEDTIQTIEAQKMVVSEYYGAGRLDSARTKLDSFMAANANDSAFAGYMDILLTLAEDSSSVFEMDSSQKSFVKSLASGSTDMAKFAEATLELVDDTIIERWPVIYNPPGAKMEGGEENNNFPQSTLASGEIRLYPNPNSGSFTLSYSNDESGAELTVVLFDIMGRELYRTVFAQNEVGKQSVEIPNKVSGFVLAQVLRGNKPVHHQSLIIQR